MKRNMRKELMIGLLLFAIVGVIRQFISAPEFILGLLYGLSICFMLVGALPDKVYNTLKGFKKRI